MTYNNETGRNEFDEWSTRAQWFVDLDGNRYVVPPPDITTEIYEAPDNVLCDMLNMYCRDHPDTAISEDWAKGIGLFPVPRGYWRFDERHGYTVDGSFYHNQQYQLWRYGLIDPLNTENYGEEKDA